MKFYIIFALLLAAVSAAPQFGFGGYYVPHGYGASPGYYGEGIGYGNYGGYQSGGIALAAAGRGRVGAGRGRGGGGGGYTNAYAG